MNTKARGDMAVGHAINHYLSSGYEVCLPIGDKRHYDVLIEKDGKIERVQIKFGGLYKKRGKCKVGLRITGGNQSFNYARNYSDDAFDILFIYTERKEKFAVPWKDVVCRNEITIEDPRYKKYKLD